jgi:hypothetical protein
MPVGSSPCPTFQVLVTYTASFLGRTYSAPRITRTPLTTSLFVALRSLYSSRALLTGVPVSALTGPTLQVVVVIPTVLICGAEHAGRFVRLTPALASGAIGVRGVSTLGMAASVPIFTSARPALEVFEPRSTAFQG